MIEESIMVTLVTFPDGSKFELPLQEVLAVDGNYLRRLRAAVNAFNASKPEDAPVFDVHGALESATTIVEQQRALAAACTIEADAEKVPLAEYVKASDIPPADVHPNPHADAGPVIGESSDPFKTGAETAEAQGDVGRGAGGGNWPDPGREPVVPKATNSVASAPVVPADPEISIGAMVDALSKHRAFAAHMGAFKSLGYRGDVKRVLETAISALDCLGVEMSGNNPNAVGAVRDAIARALGLL